MTLSEYPTFRSRPHHVIRVYDEVGNVIETHEHIGDFKEVKVSFLSHRASVPW
jgi:hypothetical protein